MDNCDIWATRGLWAARGLWKGSARNGHFTAGKRMDFKVRTLRANVVDKDMRMLRFS